MMPKTYIGFIRRMRSLRNQAAFTLVEATITSALVVGVGYTLNTVFSDSLEFQKAYTKHINLGAILNSVTSIASQRSNVFIPLNNDFIEDPPLSMKIYYACYSKKGAMLKNSKGDIGFGIHKVQPDLLIKNSQQLANEGSDPGNNHAAPGSDSQCTQGGDFKNLRGTITNASTLSQASRKFLRCNFRSYLMPLAKESSSPIDPVIANFLSGGTTPPIEPCDSDKRPPTDSLKCICKHDTTKYVAFIYPVSTAPHALIWGYSLPLTRRKNRSEITTARIITLPSI